MGPYELALTDPSTGVDEITTGDLFSVVDLVQQAPPGLAYVIVRKHDRSIYADGTT